MAARRPSPHSGLDGTSLVIDLRLDDALMHSVTLRQFCEQLVPAGVQFCLSQFEHGPDAERCWRSCRWVTCDCRRAMPASSGNGECATRCGRRSTARIGSACR